MGPPKDVVIPPSHLCESGAEAEAEAVHAISKRERPVISQIDLVSHRQSTNLERWHPRSIPGRAPVNLCVVFSSVTSLTDTIV